MSEIKIIQGDCLEVMEEIPANSIDLVVADPPYNLGKDYGNNHDLIGLRALCDLRSICIFRENGCGWLTKN